MLAVVADGALSEFTDVGSVATAMARLKIVHTLMRIGAMSIMSIIDEAVIPAVEREKGIRFYVAVIVSIAFLVVTGS